MPLSHHVVKTNGLSRGSPPRQRTWICIRNIGCCCSLHTAIPCRIPPTALAPNRLHHLLCDVVQNSTTIQQENGRFTEPCSHRHHVIQRNFCRKHLTICTFSRQEWTENSIKITIVLYFHTIIYCRSQVSLRGRSLLAILLGRKPEVMLQLIAGLEQTAVKFTIGSSMADLKAVFSEEQPSAVIMGAGLPLDIRLEMVRFVFEHSETTTVHMKDWSSGSNGMLSFMNGVAQGLLTRMESHND